MALRKYIVLTEAGGLVGDADDQNTAGRLADAAALDGDVRTYVVSAVSGIHTAQAFERGDTREDAIRADAKILVAAAKKAVQSAVTAP
jgi:hypothetical protein